MATAPVETDISKLEFWEKSWEEKEETFKWLRENEPISWQDAPPPLAEGLEEGQGFWAVTKHKHIREISRKPEVFSSAEGVFMDDFPDLHTMLSFISMDAPRHTEMRGIVSSTFTPKHMRKLSDEIHQEVEGIVDEILPKGEGDICELLTKEVPGRVFADFFGIDDKERRQFVMDSAEQLGSWADDEYEHIGSPLEVFADASQKLQNLAIELAQERRENPGDDLLSWIVEAKDEEGEANMTDEEVGVFFALLAGAANDTTRHSMAHALLTFQEHPDQKDHLFEDFDKRIDLALSELLRWRPPLLHFRRTALEDYEIGGKTIKKGDKVVLWYMSGNRDEEVFKDPYTFDISRNPNPHQSFGGGGPHLCLGNALGKQMLKHEIYQVYTRMPDIKLGEPHFMLSNFMSGVMELHATWTPGGDSNASSNGNKEKSNG